MGYNDKLVRRKDGSYIFECQICDYNKADTLMIFEGPPSNLRTRWF